MAEETEVSARISGCQRVIPHIGIPVVRLKTSWSLYGRIRAHKPRHDRIIQPPVHVDQLKVIQHLVPGKAVHHVRVVEQAAGIHKTIRITPLAPYIVGHALRDGAGRIGDRHHRT